MLRSKAVLSVRSRLAALCGTALLLAGVAVGAGATAAHAIAVSQIDIVGPDGSQNFGEFVLVLANGNYVVADPGFDHVKVPDVGAVYLYDGTTNALISTLKGTIAGSKVGEAGTVQLSSGGTPTSNFLVVSPHWASTTVGGAQGAVTWVNGTTGQTVTGLNSTVNASNSMVGSATGDQVGSGGADRLLNGNYLVSSLNWHNGATPDAGALTWGAGATGTVGVVSPANSLVGTTASDQVGSFILPLSNGNYAAFSPNWANGAALDAGAVTWGSGTTGVKGVVSPANSLVGSGPNDRIGSQYGFGVTNGNFVVSSPHWAGGGTNLGAATWCNGTSGTTVGAVSSANSLVGSTSGDQVGSIAIRLANGNYVVASSSWDNGAVTDVGAVTWGSGTAGVKGSITAANSLVGSTAGDQIASRGVSPLSNGNYVVASPFWDGPAANVGAVTWGNGVSGLTVGPVSAANSLVGSKPNDRVGSAGTTALSNGNYVVQSPLWNGAAAMVGAATWGNGATGSAVGAVSAVNSLVGSTLNDQLGDNITALANGNYVVTSLTWDGAAVDVGAVTWGNGASGATVGAASAANSLVGSTSNDRAGSGGVTALSNGNYVVSSDLWDPIGKADAGAVTWGSGTGGVVGPLSGANSLVGSAAGDRVGSYGVGPLAQGNYFVNSPFWDNGAVADAGAVTWADGQVGITGAVSPANSLVGSIANDHVGNAQPNADGSYIVVTPGWDHGGAVDAGAATYGSVTGITGTITASNSVIGAPPSMILGLVGRTSVGAYVITTSGGNRLILLQISNGLDFVPLPPARLADTRTGGATVDGQFAAGGVRAPGSVLTLLVGGRGGVPPDASAVSLNVTAVTATADGFLTVFPCGSAQPNASNLNFTTGSTVANGVIAKLGTGGAVCMYVSAGTHLIVDVNGSFPSSTTLISSNPARVLDTRPLSATADGLQQSGGLRSAGSTTTLPIAGRVGVPANANAVVLNVTVTATEAPGFLTVYPCGGPIPNASNLNYGNGATVANLVLMRLGAGGAVCIFSQSATHLIVDVTGFFPASSSYTPLDPARLLDTRPGAVTIDGQSGGADVRSAGTITHLPVGLRGGVPDGVATVMLNVTATGPTSAGFVTVYPCGIATPPTSSLNFAAGATVANAVLIQVGTAGEVCLYNSSPTQLIVDVNGYLPV